MKSIICKEMAGYFKSMIGYVFLAVFLCVSAFNFATGNLFSQNGDIKSFFQSMTLVVMFLIPILTMRLFAEERKMKTDQLLFSAPISTCTIVLGKFLATVAFFALAMAMTLIFPAVLAYYGTLEGMVAVGNYLGILLMAAAFIAIGLFVSILTENQINAAVITYAILLGLWLVDSVGILATSGWVQQVLTYLSISRQFTMFTYGILSLSNVVYYLSISALFLFLSVFVLENAKLQ